MALTMLLLATYDIVDDCVRMRVASLLHSLGPRVQLSVYEIELANRAELGQVIARLTDLVDIDCDQVRLYVLGSHLGECHVVGNRRSEERQRFVFY